jgi:hypothetical protein
LKDSDYLHVTSAILCLLYFIGFAKQGKAYRIFTIYITVILVIDFIASHLWDWFGIYNAFTSHFYDLLQFVLLSYFFGNLLETKKQLYTVYILLIILPVFLLLRYLFNPEMFFEYSLLETYFTTIPIIIYATMHLYNNLGEKTEFYYINIGLLLYLFGSTFIFLLYELLMMFHKTSAFCKNLITINIILQYIKFGFFFYQWKLIYFNKNENN